MLRDLDLINHTAHEIQLLMNKASFLAQQVQDPVVRHLLHDAARMHQRHLATLSTARAQLQQQLGSTQPTLQQLAGPAGQSGARWTQ
ncbi:MAG TPA: hypothetical protein VIK73_08990 [Limnochordales bacterium]